MAVNTWDVLWEGPVYTSHHPHQQNKSHVRPTWVIHSVAAAARRAQKLTSNNLKLLGRYFMHGNQTLPQMQLSKLCRKEGNKLTEQGSSSRHELPCNVAVGSPADMNHPQVLRGVHLYLPMLDRHLFRGPLAA